MIRIPFNINQYVSVELTDYGRTILRAKHEELIENVFARTGVRPNLVYQEPKVDERGRTQMQLWVLMDAFGDYMHMGCETPFKTDIEFEIEKLPDAPAEPKPSLYHRKPLI